MSDLPGRSQIERGLLDTLAQKRTSFGGQPVKSPMLVNGQGTDLHGTEALFGRAKRKAITQAMALALVDVATKKNKSDRVKAYWNTYHCQNKVTTDEGRIYGIYCKNRFCTLCCSIRKATLINKYLPVVIAWEDCHLVTLTVKAIPAKSLRRYCKGFIKLFGKIVEKHRKRSTRGDGNALEGLRSLECNFNPLRRTYNPHFHVLVRNKKMGEILVQEWLQRFGPNHTNPKAQHIRKVLNATSDLIEIIKYGSKIFTEPDLTKKKYKRATRYVFVSALDNILTAMEGTRIFDRFGFNLSSQEKRDAKSTLLFNYARWTYSATNSDWVNQETGELLCGYHLTKELTEILANNLDLELC